MDLQRHVRVTVNQQGVIGRRDFLKGMSLAGAGAALSWPELVAANTGELRKRGMACILLWMAGGPSQFETFDPKPGHENGGETKAIDTCVSGIQIADNYPQVAQVMDRLAIIRSLNSKEGNHPRATFLLHTGYNPTASVKHPTLGSLVTHELPDTKCELPAFVRVGGRRGNTSGGGLLGVEYDPFTLDKAGPLPSNSQPTTDVARYQRRLGLLSRMESDYASRGAAGLVGDHQKLYRKASRMILASEMKAFDIAQEAAPAREAYGEGDFAAGCLLARRLVESGVTFVEVQSNGWDTHDDNFNRVRDLAGQTDRAVAQLIRDLDERGLLDTTLVIWMGEFGRTPRITARGGRDHYPKAFNVALAGAGVRGGRVIGATSPGGDEVVGHPVSVSDLFQTFCHALKIDSSVENMSPIGRPIRVVEGGDPVMELFA
ncbi:MAG: DUF1501 domain-containing protein [Pirellulales bacterium]|nr:DUF1501 domain-containing protein [Pirellulales bacterium]